MDFDVKSKPIKVKLDSFKITDKVEGLKELVNLYASFKTYNQQLLIFGTKTKLLLRSCLSDILNFKNN